MADIKTVYEFELKIEKEVEKVEIINEGGTEITKKTKAKELVPVYFGFKKPSRGERESCDEYRAMIWSKAVEKGIMTEAMLKKHFNNQGGVLSDAEKQDYFDTLKSIDEKQNDILKENSDKDTIQKEIDILINKIVSYQNKESAFFENTAENRARIKATEWLGLFMSYFREDSAKNWEPFFKGDNLEKKYDSVEKFEESKNELYLKSRDKLMTLAAVFLSSGTEVKKEFIDSILAQI